MAATLWFSLLLLAQQSHATFNALKGYDAITQYAFGVSVGCVQALNQTVACDEATLNMAGTEIDNNYWYKQNMTTLCTAGCKTSLDSWLSAVQTSCKGEPVTQAGMVVQAKTIPLQFTYGYSLACLQNSANNWCFIKSQQWTGSDYIRYEPTMCYADNPPAICDDDDFDVEQVNPDLQTITGLYDSSTLCDECFMKVWRQRLISPFLVKNNWTDYRISAFDAMQKNCSTTMAYTTSAATLLVGTQDASDVPTQTSAPPLVTTGVAITPTCTGQVVKPITTQYGCGDLSDQYHVPTGDAIVATDDDYCQFDGNVCLPLGCDLQVIDRYGQTCAGLAKSLCNSTRNVTAADFFSWNQNILGSCDNLALGQRVCVNPPGGQWEPNSTIVGPGTAGTYYSTATPAWPTQSGSVADCGAYYQVVEGDTCNLVCLLYGVTFDLLRKLNTYLNTDCTNLWQKSSVCVGEVAAAPLSTDGTCGPSANYATCPNAGFGPCCNTKGTCGKGAGFCDAGNCFSGNCTGSSTSTTNGTCGPAFGGLTCDNPSFGPCCSIYGNCGSTKAYCGPGNCYSGKCDPDTGGLSINGECGPLFQGNKTCTGTQFGSCCSSSGYCGSTDAYCKGANCYSGGCTS